MRSQFISCFMRAFPSRLRLGPRARVMPPNQPAAPTELGASRKHGIAAISTPPPNIRELLRFHNSPFLHIYAATPQCVASPATPQPRGESPPCDPARSRTDLRAIRAPEVPWQARHLQPERPAKFPSSGSVY